MLAQHARSRWMTTGFATNFSLCKLICICGGTSEAKGEAAEALMADCARDGEERVAGQLALVATPVAAADMMRPKTEPAPEDAQRNKADARAAIMAAAIDAGLAAISTIPYAGAGACSLYTQEPEPEPEPALEDVQQNKTDARAAIMAAAIDAGRAAIATVPEVGEDGDRASARNRSSRDAAPCA